eukprot:Skav204990  [mRNA]  locus=scaffold1180:839540:844836:- [translate_table: standard]
MRINWLDCWHDEHRPCHFFANQRIGEASNPGPSTATDIVPLHVMLANPTSLYNKRQVLRNLISEQDIDVMGFAENSATAQVQYEVTSQLRSLGFKSSWTVPVEPHGAVRTRDHARRGRATGVSVHARHPLRATELHAPHDVDATRLLSTILQIGRIQIHVIVVYAYPSCHTGARSMTTRLVEVAAEWAQAYHMPTIIMGDFNMPIHEFHSVKVLMAQGYDMIDNVYRERYHCEMPHTNREATTNDLMLLSPLIKSWTYSIEVDKSRHFAEHDPVILHLHVPTREPQRYEWRLPQTWTPFEPDPVLVAKHFQASYDTKDITAEHASFPDLLTKWSKSCEQAVHQALLEQHQADPAKWPNKGLPVKCRGRAVPRNLVSKRQPRIVRKPCSGQYMPAIDVVSQQTAHRIKQVRRIQSLKHRIHSLNFSYLQPHQNRQLKDEWKAILAAKGYGSSFVTWMLQWPELPIVPLELPDAAFLEDLEQLVRFDCDAKTTAEHQDRIKHAKITTQTLAAYPPNEQNIIARDIAAVYLQTNQRSHFQEQPACPYCGSEDTVTHRILQCEATATVRQSHQSVITYLQEHNPCLYTCPVAFYDEWYEFRYFWQQSVPLPAWDEQIVQPILHRIQSGETAWFYTDGTCNRPTCPTTRRAAFAVIYHQELSETDLQAYTAQFAHSSTIPSTFQVVMVGECRHRQTISRAELQANMHLADLLASADVGGAHIIIHTDSQYVLNLLSKLALGLGLARCERWPNFDNLVTLWRALQTTQLVLRKVKAHQEHATHATALQHFHAIGNHVADQTAKHFLNRTERQTPLATAVDEEPQRLKPLYDYLYALQTHRAKLYKRADVATPGQPLLLEDDRYERMLAWFPNQTWSPDEPQIDDLFLQASLWGTTNTYNILRWLSTVQWQTDPTPHDAWVGTSWFELCYAYLASTGHKLGINQNAKQGGKFVPHLLAPYEQGTNFTAFVFAFERTVTHATKLAQKPWVPSSRQHVFSLTQLGSKYGSRGIGVRAIFPLRDQIYAQLKHHFLQVVVNRDTNRHFEIFPGLLAVTPVPQIQVHSSDEEDMRTAWNSRHCRYNTYRKQLTKRT